MSCKRNMSEKEQARVKQLMLDIFDGKKLGAVIICDENVLSLGGGFSLKFEPWSVALMAGFQLMQDIRNGEESADIAINLVNKFLEQHAPEQAHPKEIIDKIIKELKENPDKIDELIEKVAKESGMDIKATQIDLNSKSSKDFLKNMPDIIASAKLCSQVADNWIKQNKGNSNVMEFWDKHGRIFHNTPNGAIFPCGKTYTVDGGADASDHIANCKYCSDLLDSIDKIDKIKEARENNG